MRKRLLTQIIACVVGCALAGIVRGGAVSSLPATRPILQHVPDEPSQARAERMVREVYAKELASKDAQERRELARKLMTAAMETGDDSAARFVLLREARDIAASAGDAFGSRRAIILLGRFYSIDQARMLLNAMNNMQAAATSPEMLEELVQVCINAADAAVVEDDYATASKLIALAETAAGKTKNSRLISKVKERSRLVQLVIAEFEAVQKSREALKRDPDDAEACARIGRFLCLYKGDWAGGLPLTAKGADSGMRKLAQDDLSAAGEAQKRLSTGDGWWELSANQTWLPKRNLQARAAWWYRQVVGELNGIHRSIVEKRIEAVELAALADQNMVPGLGAELFKEMEFKQLAKRRVDDQINFDWGTESPDAAVGKDNFAIRWTGTIRPPSVGNYELVVVANAGARVWVDDKLILENANLARMRNGARVTVKMGQQLHPLRVDFWDSAGAARMKLLWRRPGAVKDEVIPAAVFFHEGLVEGP